MMQQLLVYPRDLNPSLSQQIIIENMVFYTQYDADTRTWSGKLNRTIYNPNTNLATIMFDSLERCPNHIGQINANSGRQFTNDEIRMNAIRLAMHLQSGHLAVRRNDVVAVVSKNHEHLSAVVLAGLALAAPINTLDPDYREDEIAHMFRMTQPKIVFCDSDSIGEVRKALCSLSLNTAKLITVDKKVDTFDAVEEMLKPVVNEQLFCPTDVCDGTMQPAVIVCTSGTTGHSKGVSLSHAILLAQMTSAIKILTGDVYLSFSSLYWLTGIWALIGGTLAGITRIITTQQFDPDLMLNLIERYGVTFTVTAPSHLARLLQSPLIESTNLSSIRKYCCGGSSVAAELLRKCDTIFPTGIMVAYGLSEVAGMIAGNETRNDDSVGTLCDGMVVQIVDEDERRQGPHVDGEIYVKAKYIFLGYWGDDVATADVLDKDGWLRTGDIGHFDDDGYLYVVDRKKDILKYRNYQISPSELENLILRCNGVSDVCVVGIPDAVSTDLPAAVVVKAEGKDVTIDEIKAIIQDHLSDAKQLRGGVYFVDSLPVTPSGKILRRKVKEIAIENYLSQQQI